MLGSLTYADAYGPMLPRMEIAGAKLNTRKAGSAGSPGGADCQEGSPRATNTETGYAAASKLKRLAVDASLQASCCKYCHTLAA